MSILPPQGRPRTGVDALPRREAVQGAGQVDVVDVELVLPVDGGDVVENAERSHGEFLLEFLAGLLLFIRGGNPFPSTSLQSVEDCRSGRGAGLKIFTRETG
jgi:hypothetical protein